MMLTFLFIDVRFDPVPCAGNAALFLRVQMLGQMSIQSILYTQKKQYEEDYILCRKILFMAWFLFSTLSTPNIEHMAGYKQLR